MVHWPVLSSQHWPARQSALDLQQATQLPLLQHCPLPHWLSAQHVLLGTQAPPQQCLPAPHWESVWQAQVPHWLVDKSQHWVARQSPSDLQQGAQAPSWQHLPAPQSASAQQVAWVQRLPQHLPVPHWASLWQAQLVVHRLVAELQHWPARQSSFELQQGTQALPWQHWPAPQSPSAQHCAVTH